MEKIGIIGLGEMGQAMIQGLMKAEMSNQIIGYHYDQQKAQKLGQAWKIKTTNDYQEFLTQVKLVIIAVRPNQLKAVVEQIDAFDLSDKILVSIISGIKIETIKTQFHQVVNVVRALPNLNAGQQMSATGVQFDPQTDDVTKKLVVECFNYMGTTYEISEAQFSAFTVIGGCTPAYFFQMVEAIYQSGVKNGLKAALALEVAIQSGLGSLMTLKASGASPQKLVDAVCVPNGITIEGINYLQEKEFSEIIGAAIKKSITKDLKNH